MWALFSTKKKGQDNIQIEEIFGLDVSFYPYVYETEEEAQANIPKFKEDLKNIWDKYYDPDWMGDYVYYLSDLEEDGRGYVGRDTPHLYRLIQGLNRGGYATPEEAIAGREKLRQKNIEDNRINHNIRPASDYERNENFDKWFEGSVVKEDDGTPKIVYHGTGAHFEEFNNEGLIFLTDDPCLANDYTVGFANRELDDRTLYVRNKRNYENVDSIDAIVNKEYNDRTSIYQDLENCPDLVASGGTIYVDYDHKWYFYVKDKQTGRSKYFSQWDSPEEIQAWLGRLHKGGLQAFYVNFKNPLEIDNHGRDWEHVRWNGHIGYIDEWSDEIKQAGYDGVIIYNCSDGNRRCATEYIAFSSNQLKSVHNEGGYDGNKMNFYESKQPTKKTIIRLTEEDLHNIIRETVKKMMPNLAHLKFI